MVLLPLLGQEGWRVTSWRLWPPRSIFWGKGWAGLCWCAWLGTSGGVTWRSAGGHRQMTTCPSHHAALLWTRSIAATARCRSSPWWPATGRLTVAPWVADDTLESSRDTTSHQQVGVQLHCEHIGVLLCFNIRSWNISNHQVIKEGLAMKMKRQKVNSNCFEHRCYSTDVVPHTGLCGLICRYWCAD